jgi:hypothetical protein
MEKGGRNASRLYVKMLARNSEKGVFVCSWDGMFVFTGIIPIIPKFLLLLLVSMLVSFITF